jgi:hypothetical protein
MSPLTERLYVASLISVNLILGALLYLLDSPVFAGVLCALGLVVAVGGIASHPADPRQSGADPTAD